MSDEEILYSASYIISTIVIAMLINRISLTQMKLYIYNIIYTQYILIERIYIFESVLCWIYLLSDVYLMTFMFPIKVMYDEN